MLESDKKHQQKHQQKYIRNPWKKHWNKTEKTWQIFGTSFGPIVQRPFIDGLLGKNHY